MRVSFGSGRSPDDTRATADRAAGKRKARTAGVRAFAPRGRPREEPAALPSQDGIMGLTMAAPSRYLWYEPVVRM